MIYTDNKDFYPTPKALFERLLNGKRFLDGRILEPSAGKGDMIRYIKERMGRRERYPIDAIENDTLRFRMFLNGNIHVWFKDERLLANSKYFNISPPELSKKASKKDRNSDWQGEEIALEPKEAKYFDGGKFEDGGFNNGRKVANNHPTVKPTDLMAWLVRLVTPAGGTVLDPFAGSGSTLVAAKREGFGFIGVELTEEYIPIIEARTGAKATGVEHIKAEGQAKE